MASINELIQFFIFKFEYNKCLGIGDPDIFNKVSAGDKTIISSDDLGNFFKDTGSRYDLIFINYSEERVSDSDISDALNALDKNGTLICENAYSGHLKIMSAISGRDDLIVRILYNVGNGTVIIRKTDSNPYFKISDDSGISIMDMNEYIKRCHEVVICAIAKREKNYIEDWCKWHLSIGFDRIYIYDNNDIDSGESYKYLEKIFPGKIEVRDVRGLIGQQILQYKSFAADGMYGWVAFIDIDEYIRINSESYRDIKDFIYKYGDTDGYVLQWKCYKANPNIDPIDKPISEYCNTPISDLIRKDSRPEYINSWYKTISRSGLNLNMNEHTVWSASGKSLTLRNCFGEQTITNDFRYRDHNNDPVWIDHYIIKNIKDFYYNKYLRGHAGLDMKGLDGYTWWNWNQNINYYTDIQGILFEKEQEFLRSRGFKPNWTFRPMADVLVHVEPKEMGWYSLKKSEIIENLLNMSDVRLTMVTSTDIKNPADYSRYNFLNIDWYHHQFSSAWMPVIQDAETYGQPQIIINIGYNIDNSGKFYMDEYVNKIVKEDFESIFGSRDIIKKSISEVIENPNIMIVSRGTIDYDENCGGYSDIIDEFLSECGCNSRKIRIRNNTYITSKDIYMSIYEKWCKFMDRYNNDRTSESNIIKDHSSGEKNPYDAWQFIYPSLVPDLEIL